MLGLRDSLLLAFTKLRTRRIRLIVTLVVSGLLFSVLIVISLFLNGLIHSVSSFTKDGYYNRFFVSADSTGFSSRTDDLKDPKYLKRAMEIYNAQIAKQTAEAKTLGIEFDPKSVPKPYYEDPTVKGADGKPALILDTSNPAAQQALLELVDRTKLDTHIKSTAAKYNAKKIYNSTRFGTDWASYGAYEFAPIINGKEQAVIAQPSSMPDPITGFASTLTTFDDSMIKPFMLKNTSLETKPGDPIPLLAPIDAAEKLLGLPALSGKATSAEKIARLEVLRTKAANLKFSVCYRNSTAVSIRTAAKAQAEDIAAHKSESGYVMPQVIYGTPTEVCKPTPIAKDTRTAEEKQLEDKTTAFTQRYGAQVAVTQPIEFKIVGLLPKSEFENPSRGIESFIAVMLNPTYGAVWRASDQAVDTNPILKSIKNDPLPAILGGPSTYYVEFNNRQDQKKFVDGQSCQYSQSNFCGGSTDLFLQPYGNPLASLYDIQDQTQTAFNWLWGIIAGISALIMMGTIGKVVADSRKETSVFRALGAKRRDITQIYLLYTTILGILTFCSALIIGALIAWYIDTTTTGGMSATAVITFNSTDLHKQFHLIGWSGTEILTIAGLVIATSLVSAIIPLLGNIRRNPVKDMREE
jgi:hypothetical protein